MPAMQRMLNKLVFLLNSNPGNKIIKKSALKSFSGSPPSDKGTLARKY